MKSNWAGLPNHLLDPILERIFTEADYMRFNMVCMPWKSVSDDSNSSQQFKIPLLLIPTEKEGVWNFYDIGYDKFLDLQLRLPNKRFCGSSKGWLMFVEEDFSITLLNPFSMIEERGKKENSMVLLPQLGLPYWMKGKELASRDYVVYKAMISSNPILDAGNCIDVVIYEDHCRIAFIRVGKDTKWSYLDKRWTLMEEVILFGNKFYATDQYSNLTTFDTSSKSTGRIDWLGGYIHRKKIATKYLVNIGDKELLLIHRYYKCEDEKLVTHSFNVFEWNFGLEKWTEKETLENIALLVGDNSSMYVLASSKGSKYQPNFIYFNFRFRRGGIEQIDEEHDYGVYDYGNRCILQPPYNICTKKLMDRAKRPPIFVDVSTFDVKLAMKNCS